MIVAYISVRSAKSLYASVIFERVIIPFSFATGSPINAIKSSTPATANEAPVWPEGKE